MNPSHLRISIWMWLIPQITRMYSRRMRTARALTIRGCIPARGCTCQGGVPTGGVPVCGCTCQGVYLPRRVPGWGVYLPRGYLAGGVNAGGHTCQGMYLLRGVYLPGVSGWVVYLPGVYLPTRCTCQGVNLPRYSLLWTEWHTGAKILPYPKLHFADGKNNCFKYVGKKMAQSLCWLTKGLTVLHQRWIWGKHCTQARKHASKGCTLAFKPRADITKSLKQGY